MLIRRISNDEGHLVYELFNAYRIFYKQDSDIEAAKHFIEQRLKHNESVIFVAVINNVPIGFTQLYPIYSSKRMEKNWILNDLYVLPEERKNGIGTALIKAAMEFSIQREGKILQLSTAIDNVTAQRLYEEIGFTKLDPETDFYTYQISL